MLGIFEIKKYFGLYEDKNKNYIAETFSSKEEAFRILDNSDVVHEINIISPTCFYTCEDRTRFNNYFKKSEMYFLSIVLNEKLLIIQELRTDTKDGMLKHINSYLKDILSNERLILGFSYIKDGIKIDLELLKNENNFEIIEKR